MRRRQQKKGYGTICAECEGLCKPRISCLEHLYRLEHLYPRPSLEHLHRLQHLYLRPAWSTSTCTSLFECLRLRLHLEFLRLCLHASCCFRFWSTLLSHHLLRVNPKLFAWLFSYLRHLSTCGCYLLSRLFACIRVSFATSPGHHFVHDSHLHLHLPLSTASTCTYTWSSASACASTYASMRHNFLCFCSTHYHIVPGYFRTRPIC